MARMRDMPDIWGSGQLLAFSGVDGHTDNDHPFVLHTGARPGELVVRLPGPGSVQFLDMPGLEFDLVLGDVITGRSQLGEFRAVFVDHHTLAGEIPAGARMEVAGQEVAAEPLQVAAGMDMAVFAARDGSRWTLFATEEITPVAEAPRKGLSAELDEAQEQRVQWVLRCSERSGLEGPDLRLLRKALSVMKVNVEAPCGRIKRRWTTPDRWPHRHMWLWDSAFHALGLAEVDPALGQDAVLAMLDQVQPEGLLPHMVPATAPPSEITQPPVLAWACRRLLEVTQDRDFAAECLPPLVRYLDWMRENRDRNRNDLVEWHIEGAPLCRCGESGLDNSPRFDAATLLDAVDFSALLAHDYECAADLAAALGRTETEATCREHSARICAAVNDLLWSESHGLYLDRDFEGNLSGVKAVSSFFPLLAGIPDPARAARMVASLRDPAQFATPMPIPSTSVDSGRYCKDMWRGPAWVNTNTIVLHGLRRCGFPREADALRDATLKGILTWYEREGCLFEYYDSLNLTSPRDLDRKQRLISGHGIAPISDYHWTAALTVALLLERSRDGS